ncbi:MAG: putative D,D-dipeptide transport system permease protein DdpC [Alphaproteobacteria bacterium MarineAlpha5_Bin9]|nr:MAG: putative D,D-dipeptide transport system permease protein DdpC [Alphaproteobacteria bacterium MarineAlpha5_Bin9]|tara:strand:- start:14221 stop:15069 length:849 start_codon:yes stop_codon:yes gene_type:complete
MNIFKTKSFYKFSRNPLSVFGLIIVVIVLLLAIFAPYITPFPEHVGPFTDFANKSKPPDSTYIFGTDKIGRDIFTRCIYGYRISLILGVVVLSIAVPIGVTMGLCAGYIGKKTELILMRITDIFLAIPALVLALSIIGLLDRPNLVYTMIAVSMAWWPWYTRLIYNLTRSIKTEGYITASEVMGASKFHIMFWEILPNCLPSLLTKITLDLGFVILVGSSLSFLGLGAQPPTPDLGTMVAKGASMLPDTWWFSLFPGFAILIVVLGFNLVGDGLKDMFDVDV